MKPRDLRPAQTLPRRLVLAAAVPALLIAAAPGEAEARCCYQSASYYRVYYYTHNPTTYQYTVLPPRWSVGLHLTGLSANHKIGDDGVAMGGMGGHIRVRGYRLGAELAVDVVGNNFAEGGVERVSVPIQASGMLYLIPRGRFNLYLVGGLRFVPSHVRWRLPDLHNDQTFTEVGGQVGVGGELLLSRFFSLTADLRGYGTVRNDNDIAGKFYKELDTEQGTPVPSTSAGLQLSLGASFRF